MIASNYNNMQFHVLSVTKKSGISFKISSPSRSLCLAHSGAKSVFWSRQNLILTSVVNIERDGTCLGSRVRLYTVLNGPPTQSEHGDTVTYIFNS